jgi:hypothetical protein
VDQVVGDVDAVHRLLQPRPGQRVAEHDVVERHPGRGDPLGRAREAAHHVARVGQRRRERRADVARDARDQDLHPHTLPYGSAAKTAHDAGSGSRIEE